MEALTSGTLTCIHHRNHTKQSVAMYTRRLSCKTNQTYCRHLFRSKPNHPTRDFSQYTSCAPQITSPSSRIRKLLSDPFPLPGISSNNGYALRELNTCHHWNNGLRLYCSKGGNEGADDTTKDDKHVPVVPLVKADASNLDAHACLGEQDQKEWMDNEKLTMESKTKDSPFLCRRERFKNELLRRVIPWEKITLSWETFPYYVHQHTKTLLVECAASHLKHNKFAAAYGARLPSSSGRILLQSVPGTELYRERLVKVLAQDLQVPLLVLDSSVLAPYNFGEEPTSEDSGDENSEEGVEDSSEEDEDEKAASNEVLKKLIPYSLEDFKKKLAEEYGIELGTGKTEKPETVQSPEQSKRPLRKGDRVKYTGPSIRVEADNRSLPNGQRGEVYEVNGDRVAVILDGTENKTKGNVDEKSTEDNAKTSVYWIHIQDIERDLNTQPEEAAATMEVLSVVLSSLGPAIVYFPDSSEWLSKAVSKSNREEFVSKVEEMFNRLSGPVVLICGQNKVEGGPREKEKHSMAVPNFNHLGKLFLSLQQVKEGSKGTKSSRDNELYNLFTNVVSIQPPKEDEVLRTFNKQVEEDRRIVLRRSNINELHKVLEEHELSCMGIWDVNTDGVILTKRKAEQIVGWARNHYLSSCLLPSVKGERLSVPCESLEAAILRLKEHERILKKPLQSLKNLASDEYESNFVSAVVPPGEIGVKFDDIGALEQVKQTLGELVTLPMRRPELFSHGNLLRPCKGILLFGPPGTGKTLLAKALATEAGANFISITGSTLTSKWYGDAEKLTKALFSFANKLAPVIIFVDEIDSLLGARGRSSEHEATRKIKNEFMAAWDGLRSKDSQRILILGATNRPFDLDDAVIRRMPRRICVDLPNAGNRMKILKIFLAKENLERDFRYDELANATEGYSGSDLKNLCTAAAYRPVQELLNEEKKVGANNVTSVLRPLNLEDFIQAKAKVGASVKYDAASMNELRKWNEQYGEGGSRRKSPFGFGD